MSVIDIRADLEPVTKIIYGEANVHLFMTDDGSIWRSHEDIDENHFVAHINRIDNLILALQKARAVWSDNVIKLPTHGLTKLEPEDAGVHTGEVSVLMAKPNVGKSIFTGINDPTRKSRAGFHRNVNKDKEPVIIQKAKGFKKVNKFSWKEYKIMDRVKNMIVDEQQHVLLKDTNPEATLESLQSHLCNLGKILWTSKGYRTHILKDRTGVTLIRIR